MKSTNLTKRSKTIHTVLKRLYDPYGEHCNVVDMLTDLRHLCAVQQWDFNRLNELAAVHHGEEHANGTTEC